MPDGVDTSMYRSQPNPLATITNMMGIANTAQQNQLLQTANQQRQLELQQGYANDLLSATAPLINKPGLTQAEVLATMADRARQIGAYGLPAYNIAAQRYKGPDWQENLKADAIRARGPGAITDFTQIQNPITGAPNIRPTTSLIGAGTIQSGVPTGFTELATGPAGAAGITNMAAMANDAPNQRANLENLNALSSEAVSGPTSDFEKRANALAMRLFGTGVTLTADQLKNSEEYGKISEQLAGQQATAAHATNAFLANAYSTNPGLYMSKLGRQGVTHMLQGNLDSIVAKNNEWNAYANGEIDGRMHSPAEFATWNRRFNTTFNPRAFQYARMTPEERSSFRATLPKAQQKQFFNTLQDYQSKGWIDLTGQ